MALDLAKFQEKAASTLREFQVLHEEVMRDNTTMENTIEELREQIRKRNETIRQLRLDARNAEAGRRSTQEGEPEVDRLDETTPATD